MARFHQTETGLVPFTPAEEAEYDAMAIQYEIEQADGAWICVGGMDRGRGCAGHCARSFASERNFIQGSGRDHQR